MKLHYPLRKGKKDPNGDSDVIRAATLTTDPECTGLMGGLPVPQFKEWDLFPVEPPGQSLPSLREYL